MIFRSINLGSDQGSEFSIFEAFSLPVSIRMKIISALLVAGGNSLNGHSCRNLKISYGDIELLIPRDRNAAFETQMVTKYLKTRIKTSF